MRYARYVLEIVLENSPVIRADRLNLNGERHVLYHFDLQSCFHESNFQNCRGILPAFFQLSSITNTTRITVNMAELALLLS